MTDAAALAPSPSADAHPRAAEGGWARPMLDRQLQVLGELAEIGLELARAVEAEAKGPEPDKPDVDRPNLDRAVLAYARVARAVRQTIMLQARLIEALQAAEAGEADKARALQARRAKVKDAVRRVVRAAVEAEHEAPEAIERLCAEAAERLEAEAFGDLIARPFREIVAEVCADLGLDPDWPALEPKILQAELSIADEADEDDNGSFDLYWLGDDGPVRVTDSS
jgi:hypothetical protein